MFTLPRNTCNYSIPATDSYRLGSRMITVKLTSPPRDGKRGSNMQNWEKSVRKLFVSDGWNTNDPATIEKLVHYLLTKDLSIFTEEERARIKIFVQVDQAGAEALIVAYLCRHGNFRDLFINNVKPHVYVGLQVFTQTWKDELANAGSDIRPDIDLICKSPINTITSYPFWKQIDKLIKSSDNWPAERRYYYIAKQICHACLTPNHEVLTKNGWVNIAHVNPLDEIAVWATDNLIKFETPLKWNSYNFNGEVINFIQPELDQCVTPNHKMIVHTTGGYKDRTASDVVTYKESRVPTSGYYSGNIELNETDIKLIVAIQADGYLTSNSNVRFRFKKSRKKIRLLNLIKDRNYEFKQTFKPAEGVVEIYIYNIKHLIEWLSPDKKFDNKLFLLNGKTLDTLIDELKYWDGTFEESYCHKREAYFSKHIENVEIIKTILHLRGKQGTLNKNSGEIYLLGINSRQKSRVNTHKKLNYIGKVYCPTTSTGYFLVRRNGKISITGNSNYGMAAGMFQLNTLEKSRGKIVISKKEAERYLDVYHSLFPEIHEWHRQLERQLTETRTLYNLFGYPRYFWFPSVNPDDVLLKKAYAFPAQSTVGTITNIAFTELQNHIEENKLKWDLLANTHDSYMTQVPIGEEDIAVTKMQEFINRELIAPSDGTKFRMKSESVVGFNWSPHHSIKNPLGLIEYN